MVTRCDETQGFNFDVKWWSDWSGWSVPVLPGSVLIPLQLVVHQLGSLGQADGVQVEVPLEEDGATAESSGQSAGEAAHKHVLTCRTNQDTQRVPHRRGHADVELRGRPTCQVEVLQRRLRSHRGVHLGAEAGGAVIGAVDLPFGRSDVVSVCDGRPRVHVLDLHTPNRTDCLESP